MSLDGLVGWTQLVGGHNGVVAIVVVSGLVEEQATLRDLPLLVELHVDDLRLLEDLAVVQPVEGGSWIPMHRERNAVLQVQHRLLQG